MNIVKTLLKHTILFLFFANANLYSGYAQECNRLLIVKTYVQNQQYDKVIDFFENTNKTLITNELKKEIGIAYYKKKQIKQATNIFLELNKTKPMLCNLELARCYSKLKKAQLSVKYLQAYLQLKNKKTISEIKSDKAFKNIDNSKEWIELWKKDWYTQNELMLNDAIYEYKIGNYNESVNILETLTNKLHKNHEAYMFLCLNYIAINKHKLAIKTIDKAIKIKPKNTQYLFLKSKTLYQIGKHKQALKNINIAITQDSSVSEYYLLKTQICLQMGKNNEAKSIMDKILTYNNNLNTYAIAGKIYYENKNYLSALKYYNTAIEGGVNKPNLYIERGDVYAKSGLLEFAENDYSMALDFFPTNGELFYKRAKIRIKQKKYTLACSDLNKAKLHGFVKAENLIKQFCN